MTMHVIPGFFATTNKKQKPTKFTKAQMNKFQDDLREHNNRCKREGRHSEKMNIDQYIDFIHGINIKKAPSKTELYVPKKDVSVRESTKHIKSLNSGHFGACTLAPKKEYTGNSMVGIATMHKSNAVPVFNHEQAEEISRMRR